jgi:hypothetical protein
VRSEQASLLYHKAKKDHVFIVNLYFIRRYGGILEGRTYSGEFHSKGEIILKWILEDQNINMGPGQNWLRILSSSFYKNRVSLPSSIKAGIFLTK